MNELEANEIRDIQMTARELRSISNKMMDSIQMRCDHLSPDGSSAMIPDPMVSALIVCDICGAVDAKHPERL